MRKWPAYAGVLARIDPIATTVVPIAAVALRRWNDPSSRIQLLVNLDYFSAHLDQREAILLHEIQHVLLGHLRNAKFHAVRYPRVMDLAMEISADEPLSELLPDEAFRVETFAPFGVSRGRHDGSSPIPRPRGRMRCAPHPAIFVLSHARGVPAVSHRASRLPPSGPSFPAAPARSPDGFAERRSRRCSSASTPPS